MVDDPEWFDRKAYMKKYKQRPEVKAARKAYMKEYNKRPEVAEKRREYMREWQQRKRAENAGR